MWCTSLKYIYVLWNDYNTAAVREIKKYFPTCFVPSLPPKRRKQYRNKYTQTDTHTFIHTTHRYYVLCIHDMFSVERKYNQIENYTAEAEWRKKRQSKCHNNTNEPCRVRIIDCIHWKVQIMNDCRSIKMKWTLEKYFILYMLYANTCVWFVSIQRDKPITVLVSKFLIRFAWFPASYINRYTSHGFFFTAF